MALTYKYRDLPGKKGVHVKTPSIPITFKGNSPTKIEAVALIDSGADCSVIPKGLADVLNIAQDGPKQDSFGFGGKIVCIESQVHITLLQAHEKYEFKIPILIAPDDSCPLIIGRNGFFDGFKITFDGQSKHLVLKRQVSRPNY